MGSEETKIYTALLIAGFIFFAVVIAFLITIINYQRKSVSAYLERMKADLELSERERKRWASDVHDEFGSKISAIKMLTYDLTPGNEKEEILLEKIAGSISNLMHSVRQISNNLVPYAIQREGLLVSLDELIQNLFSGTSVNVISEWTISSADIDPEFEIYIYRIVQELFTNIIKHANANVIHISLKRAKQIIHLQVTDNGLGFNQKSIQKSSHGLGLRNIMARVNVMNGSIYLTTAPGKGTSYLIELPAH